MSKEKNKKGILLFVLSVSLIITSLTAISLTYYYSNTQFRVLGYIFENMIKKIPEKEQEIMEILKSQNIYTKINKKENILTSFGYDKFDFLNTNKIVILIAFLCFLIGGVLFVLTFSFWNKKTIIRIEQLTDYLENINKGGQGVLVDTTDDKFSHLQDEIYKTITTLYQTREDALKAKENFAKNLSNIAHQLKTPITSISLSAQMIKENLSYNYLEQIQKQLYRLTYFEEALLLLSRIDAGTLTLKPKVTDVFTLLILASDNLEELFQQAGVVIDIPEKEGITVFVDMDWTMEAIINVMKNCMEHSPSGSTIHCFYEENPLYVQIRIWDEGEGFEKEDLFHIFERFYRGKDAADNGIGIGLPLAKSIIEMQNGIISASNLMHGGACFEIRFYSH